MSADIFQIGACIMSGVACLVSIGTFIRAGKWRDTDEAKELVRRVDGTEARLTVLETDQDHLATKADIRGLKAELEGVESTVNAKIDGLAKSLQVVAGGVNRIETFFLEKGVK